MKPIQVFCLILAASCCMQFQCKKNDVLCPTPQEKKTSAYQLVQPRSQYGTGDTLKIKHTLPYSFFSSFSTNPDSLANLTGSLNYSIFEIIRPNPGPNPDLNALYSGTAFRHTAPVGTLYEPQTPVALRELYSVSYKPDPARKLMELEINLVPQKAGHYAILLNWARFVRTSGNPCQGFFQWGISPSWDVANHNEHIPASLGIGNMLIYKLIGSGVWERLVRADVALYYFTVQ